MPTLVDVQWKREKNKMTKQNLHERFQQLAGIKPLYETGKLNIITEQTGSATGSGTGSGTIPTCYTCPTSSGQPILDI